MTKGKVLIARKGGVAIYGEVVDNKSGKLGNFEVYTNFSRASGIVHQNLSEAEDRFKFLSKDK